MKKKSLYLFVFSLAIASIFGCGDKEKLEPAYIYIAPFKLDVLPNQGEPVLKSAEGHVFVDGLNQGAFLTGRVYPINELGSKEFKIFPGIRIINDGFGNVVPIIYPFTDEYISNRNLKAGKVDTIYPVSKYNNLSEFALVQNFEFGHAFNNDVDKNINTKIDISTVDGPSGKFGEIKLDSVNKIFEVKNDTKITFKKKPLECYLEFDYMNTINLNVGINIFGTKTGSGGTVVPKLSLNPKSNWTRAYVKLSSDIAVSNATDIEIIFGATLLNSKSTVGNIKLDNVKLIYK
jgi:hypothetical protein